MESPSRWWWGQKQGNLLKIGSKLNRTLKRGLPDKKTRIRIEIRVGRKKVVTEILPLYY
jgi:hypothetical protein